MSATISLPATRSPAKHRWIWWVAGTLFVLFLALVLFVASYFRLGPDARALRGALMKSSDSQWGQRIALNVGSPSTSLARKIAFSFGNFDPDARAVFQSVESFDFSVNQLQTGGKRPDYQAMLAEADATMTARGWTRVVAAMRNNQLVGVYVPDEVASADRLKFCFMALDGHEMVVASVRDNPTSLVQRWLSRSNVRDKVHAAATQMQAELDPAAQQTPAGQGN